MKRATGEGERRECARERDFSVGKKAGAAGGHKKACSTEARAILFTQGAAQGSLVAGWRGPPRGVLARPGGASAARCHPPCQPGSGRPGRVASCRNLRHCFGGCVPTVTAEHA